MTVADDEVAPLALDHKYGWRGYRYVNVDGRHDEIELTLRLGDQEITRRAVLSNSGNLCGDSTRDLLLVQAIASYLNAGGSAQALQIICDGAVSLAGAYEFALPDGYTLLDTLREDGVVQHLFVNKETQDVLVFAEDQYIEHVSLSDIFAMSLETGGDEDSSIQHSEDIQTY